MGFGTGAPPPTAALLKEPLPSLEPEGVREFPQRLDCEIPKDLAEEPQNLDHECLGKHGPSPFHFTSVTGG